MTESTHTTTRVPVFSGKEDDFTFWTDKFESYCHKIKISKWLTLNDDGDAINADTDYTLWCEIVQCLDKRTLMMIRAECKGKGQKAWKQLHTIFKSSERSRVMMLMKQFTNLQLQRYEKITDFLIRTEQIYTDLNSAGENVSENMLTTMILKGLPATYDSFITVKKFGKNGYFFVPKDGIRKF